MVRARLCALLIGWWYRPKDFGEPVRDALVPKYGDWVGKAAGRLVDAYGTLLIWTWAAIFG